MEDVLNDNIESIVTNGKLSICLKTKITDFVQKIFDKKFLMFKMSQQNLEILITLHVLQSLFLRGCKYDFFQIDSK